MMKNVSFRLRAEEFVRGIVLSCCVLAVNQAEGAASVSLVSVDHSFTVETLENSKLFVPDGAGPFPAVVVMHGSGGLWKNDNALGGVMNDHFEEWGTRFQDAGYVALFIDSYTVRGVVEFANRRPAADPNLSDALCSNRHVRPLDAYSALDYLRAQPNVIDDRVALMGFSQGAESVLVAVTDESVSAMQAQWEVRYLNLDTTITNQPVPAPYTVPNGTGFRTAVAYYPGCGFYNYFGQSSVAAANRYMPSVPTFVLHGTDDSLYSDDLYPLVLRDKANLHAQAINEPVTIYPWPNGMGGNQSGVNPFWHQTYANVGHSFSELEPLEAGYDQKLAAIDDVMLWLEFYLEQNGIPDSSVEDWRLLE